MNNMIKFDEQENLFILSNQHVSYIMEVLDDTYLLHRYWGKKLPSYHFSNKPELQKRTFAATPNIETPELSPEFFPFEMPFSNMGDFRNSGVQCHPQERDNLVRFKYQNFSISNDIVEVDNLPHVRANKQQSQTLTINLFDNISKIQLSLFYTIFYDSPIITRFSKITNHFEGTIDVTKILSASIDFSYDKQAVTYFHGTHQKEYQLNTASIEHGLFKIGSSRGASGPQYPPFIALSKNTTEFSGNVHAMTLIYSGNHEINLERDQYNQIRLQIGLNSDSFKWSLDSGESLYSPQALLSFSDKGFNGLSNGFHHFFKNHLINPEWKNKERPILVNSWEMSYFDVNEDLMIELIDSASELGFETVVLDDGWFGNRNDSKSSLGDWTVDKKKFPNGIDSMVQYAKKQNIGFGLWFEPEMISPSSDLILCHPEWVMRSQQYDPILGRNQNILDLTNPEVQDFIIETISKSIETFKISYIKWDMNRHVTEPFSLQGNIKGQDYMHTYILGLYYIINILTKKYPHILFENCSSGGGRLDPGMLYYFPQTWISDNTDGLDRQKIQYGASYLFPISSITGHVSAIPNHQTGRSTPYKTRTTLASSTNMGYEMNIIHLSTEEKRIIKNNLRDYKNDRNLIMNGNFFRLYSPFEENLCAWMFIDEEKENAIIRIIRNLYSIDEFSILVHIPYLDENYLYEDIQSHHIYSAIELQHCGLSIKNSKGDFQTTEIKLKKLNQI